MVDYEAAGEYSADLQELFGSGLNITLNKPPAALVEKKEKIQEYLRREGFVTEDFSGVTFPWYQGEMKESRDVLYTYSTSDWMMNPDFAPYNKDWAYHSVDELKDKIDADPWLQDETSRHIVLAHDHNNMYEVTTALIDHMQKRSIEFVDVMP